MTGSCKHFATRPETDLQEFELVAKNSKYKTQPICCICRETILAEETRHIKILDYQRETLIICNEFHDTIEPVEFPGSPVKHQEVGSTLLNIPHPKTTLSLDNALKDHLGALFHINSVLEAKIKSQTMLSDDLGALSLFTIEQAGEIARINGLNVLRSLIDKKVINSAYTAYHCNCPLDLLFGNKCSSWSVLLSADLPYERVQFQCSECFSATGGALFSNICFEESVSTVYLFLCVAILTTCLLIVYCRYIPSSKHPTQLEDFDLGLLGLFQLIEAFSTTIQVNDSDT